MDRLTIWKLIRAAILWFVVCAGASMLLYPGGTRLDRGAVGYSFTQNAFSELGRTVARNGEPNLASATLFVLGLTPAGLGLAAFFVALLPLVSNHSRTARWLARLGCVAGIIAGVAYVAVAWTPADRLPAEHVFAERVAFRVSWWRPSCSDSSPLEARSSHSAPRRPGGPLVRCCWPSS